MPEGVLDGRRVLGPAEPSEGLEGAGAVSCRPLNQEEKFMATSTDAPVDLYIAAYSDPDAARYDWDAFKELAEEGVIKVEGLVLVSRRSDGKIHVDDNFHTARKGAKWGAVGGAVVGLIFPPTILAGALVGAGAGLGVGGLVSHHQKAQIKADVEEVLPINSSGIVALFEEQWAPEVDKTLGKATTVTKEKVEAKSAEEVTTAVEKNPP